MAHLVLTYTKLQKLECFNVTIFFFTKFQMYLKLQYRLFYYFCIDCIITGLQTCNNE